MVTVKSLSDVAPQPVEGEAVGVSIQVLIGPGDGASNFVMRRFTVEPGGTTPFHDHPWEHEIYVLEGQGVAVDTNGETPLEAGHTVLVPAGETHCFRNTGEGPFRFLCMVPTEKHYVQSGSCCG
jgi:quercetin dioxygenase-like cupin family protein